MANRAFRDPNDPNKMYQIAKGFLGTAPDWLQKDLYFQRCVESGTITLPMSPKDGAVSDSIKDAAALQQAVEKKRIAKRKAQGLLTDPDLPPTE
jgi:hypothetical protein